MYLKEREIFLKTTCESVFRGARNGTRGDEKGAGREESGSAAGDVAR
jgi:hypothetical protein